MNTSLYLTKSKLKDYRNLHILCSSNKISHSDIYNRLTIITQATDTLKYLPVYGEVYYKIIYYNYLSPEVYFSTLEILDVLKNEGIYLSLRTYYRYKSKALYWLTEILKADQYPQITYM